MTRAAILGAEKNFEAAAFMQQSESMDDQDAAQLAAYALAANKVSHQGQFLEVPILLRWAQMRCQGVIDQLERMPKCLRRRRPYQ